MALNLEQFVERKHYFRSYERREISFLHRLLLAGDTMIDVGANVGVLALEAATAVTPGGKVVAIEPISANVDRLRANARLNHQIDIDVVQCAAGRASGTIRLGISAEQGAIRNSGSYSSSADGSVVEVPIERLDHLVAERCDIETQIRLLKIDVEGMEAQVIEGASTLFEAGRIDAVMFEWNSSVTTESAADSLRAYGFEVFELGAWGRLRIAPQVPKQTSTKQPRPPKHGLRAAVAAWCRGDGRLHTLIATLPNPARPI
jgi:FkbM family methyltransferase